MSNFKVSNHFLKFNQALCYMFLGEFEKAINIYRKLLTYPGEYFKRNVVHNLIICSEICGQPCKEVMFHLKKKPFPAGEVYKGPYPHNVSETGCIYEAKLLQI